MQKELLFELLYNCRLPLFRRTDPGRQILQADFFRFVPFSGESKNDTTTFSSYKQEEYCSSHSFLDAFLRKDE